jgi:enolase
MTAIDAISARTIPDSRGEATIEVTVRLQGGAEGAAEVPQGKSSGAHEAVYVPAEMAAKNVEGELADALRGLDATDQEAIDRKVCEVDGTPNKSRLGANAILGISFAAARASARAADLPLWQHLGNLYGERSEYRTPVLYMNLINGGLHAENDLAIQEYLIAAQRGSAADSLVLGEQFYTSLGELVRGRYGNVPLGDEGGFAIPNIADDALPLTLFDEVRETLGANVTYGIDAAATSIDRPEEALTELYRDLTVRFPFSYIEDPYDEEAFAAFAALRAAVPESVRIIGDDLTVTNPARAATARERGSISGIIIKPNQIGTLSETFALARLAAEAGWHRVVSHRSGETSDDFIADLAVAIGADGLKAGAPGPIERLTKYRRLADIETEMS